MTLSIHDNETSKPKSSQLLTVKPTKHKLINLLAKKKWDSISDITSKTVQDENISPAEFHKILPKRDGKIDISKIQSINESKNQAKGRDWKTKQSRSKPDYKRTARRIAWTTKKRGQRRPFTENPK